MVDHGEIGLQMDLRLAVGAHAAHCSPQPVVAERQRGDQRMQRRLARLDPVGICRVEREVGRPVLQHDARAPRHHRRAKTAIERVDQRHGVAVCIDGGDVDRVAGQTAVGRDAVPRDGPHRVHQPAPLVGVFLGDQAFHRYIGEARVGQMAVAVVIGELLGLHHEMHVVGTQERLLVHLQRLEQVQHLQHGEALRRRGRFVDGDTAIAALERFAPARDLRL